MDLQQQVNGDGIASPYLLDAEDHGIDVPEDLDRGDVGWVVAQLPGCFCPQQSASPDLQPLDSGGGDRLCPEQNASKRLGIDQACRLDVQACDGRLGVYQVSGDLAGRT